MIRRVTSSRLFGRMALKGAAGITLAYILTPLVFVTWLAFFRQEIPSFPPEGYSLRWFWAIADNDRFVSGFVLSLQLAVIATSIGLCLGLQCAIIEFARNVLKLGDANSTEIDRNCRHPVVCMLDEQFHITDMGGTMRLGAYPCELVEGSKAHEAYAALQVDERHRHRYEFNNTYRAQFGEHGLVV